MSGGAVLTVLEDIRRMTEIIVFCAEVGVGLLAAAVFHRLTRGR